MPPATEDCLIMEQKVSKSTESDQGTTYNRVEMEDRPNSMVSPTDENKYRWSMSSGEFEFHTAVQPRKKRKELCRWIIPSTDSDDDGSYPKVLHEPTESQQNSIRFNLPSDSEAEHDEIDDKYCDENPYEFATSPTRVIDMDVPPLPPPISSIPSRLYLGKPCR